MFYSVFHFTTKKYWHFQTKCSTWKVLWLILETEFDSIEFTVWTVSSHLWSHIHTAKVFISAGCFYFPRHSLQANFEWWFLRTDCQQCDVVNYNCWYDFQTYFLRSCHMSDFPKKISQHYSGKSSYFKRLLFHLSTAPHCGGAAGDFLSTSCQLSWARTVIYHSQPTSLNSSLTEERSL